MSLLKALFMPIMPPKNYSFEDRNFESEYKEMKNQYLEAQRRIAKAKSSSESNYQMSAPWEIR